MGAWAEWEPGLYLEGNGELLKAAQREKREAVAGFRVRYSEICPDAHGSWLGVGVRGKEGELGNVVWGEAPLPRGALKRGSLSVWLKVATLDPAGRGPGSRKCSPSPTGFSEHFPQ